MTKVYAVYQDCVLCGDKGRKKIAEWAEKGVEIEKVGFTSPLGRELCDKAVFSHGVKSMPFFTDGRTFSETLESFLEEKPEKPAKKTKKNKKNQKGMKNGTISEA